MPKKTYEPIYSTTLTSNTTTVSLTSIPQTHNHIRVVVKSAGTASVNAIRMRINGDTGNNYSAQWMGNYATTQTGQAEVFQSQTIIGNWATVADGLGKSIMIIDFPNYRSTTSAKTFLSQFGLGSTENDIGIHAWTKTPEAITQLSFNIASFGASSGDFITGCSFDIYGYETMDTAAAKATGGTVTTDDNYVYHTFTASGTFTPSQTISADYLIVAGGGGGGGQQGGGGGAGGVRAFTGASLSATGYTVTVGAGGSGGTGQYNTSVGNGGNTSFNSTSVTGGGHGAANGLNDTTADGVAGGSGGGGGINNALSGAGNAGSYSPVEGYAGGAGLTNKNGGGGGGGAGGAGTAVIDAGVDGIGGAGGIGTYTYNSINFTDWLIATGVGVSQNGLYYIAGGGGGGGNYNGALGGYGGGGDGNRDETSSALAYQNALKNTGGGGGGGSQSGGNGVGGKGGSGVVIVRYAR